MSENANTLAGYQKSICSAMQTKFLSPLLPIPDAKIRKFLLRCILVTNICYKFQNFFSFKVCTLDRRLNENLIEPLIENENFTKPKYEKYSMELEENHDFLRDL